MLDQSAQLRGEISPVGKIEEKARERRTVLLEERHQLTGKYTRTDVHDSREAAVSPSRKGVIASSGHLTERSIEIAHEVRAVADEVGSIA